MHVFMVLYALITALAIGAVSASASATPESARVIQGLAAVVQVVVVFMMCGVLAMMSFWRHKWQRLSQVLRMMCMCNAMAAIRPLCGIGQYWAIAVWQLLHPAPDAIQVTVLIVGVFLVVCMWVLLCWNLWGLKHGRKAARM
jgi:hypothetical protein